MQYGIGIDVGSTSVKTAVLDRDGAVLFTDLRPTGWSTKDSSASVLNDVEKAGFALADSGVVATGYGRVSVTGAQRTVTEISCHAAGASSIYGRDSLTVIDIGGQDTKVIDVRSGRARDFRMNDKCSAGTGRFLEIMGNAMGSGPDQLCELARDGGGVRISSMCTVFAESEVIGLIGRGERKENIAAAIVESIVDKVSSQASGFVSGDGPPVCITGGLCEMPYLIEALSVKLRLPILTDPLARFAGAIGAAQLAFTSKSQ